MSMMVLKEEESWILQRKKTDIIWTRFLHVYKIC